MGTITPEQVPTAPLQQPCNVFDVGSREVVQAGLEHVEDQVWGNNPEFSEVGQEHDILRSQVSARQSIEELDILPTFVLDSVSSLTFFLRCKYLNSSLS